MSEQVEQKNFFEKLANNQKLLAGGGLFMFFLGLISWFMAMADDGVTDERMKATLASIILLAMGYPMMLHVGVQKKLKATEDRVQHLEQLVEGCGQAKSGESPT